MRTHHKILFWMLWFVGLALSAGLLWFITLIPSYSAPPDATGDAVVVLTGGPLRIEHGFELLADGHAPELFISGVETGVTLPLLLRKKEYHNYVGRISADHITLGYKAHSTAGNAEEIAEWLATNHVHHILLVTGNYHIPRSTHELEHAVPGLVITPEPVFLGYFTHDNYQGWFDGSRLIVSEYFKFLLSMAQHAWAKR